MTASHAGFIFLQCPHQGARNLIKTVLPSVMSSQLRGVGERVTSYIRTRGDAGAALVGSELDGRGRTEQRERDEQFHRPARALSSVRGRHTTRKRGAVERRKLARRANPTAIEKLWAAQRSGRGFYRGFTAIFGQPKWGGGGYTAVRYWYKLVIVRYLRYLRYLRYRRYLRYLR